MSIIEKIKMWCSLPKRWSSALSVTYDHQWVHTKVLHESMDSEWNQSFRWDDIVKVGFKDEGVSESDMIFIFVPDREDPFAVPTEAKGGSAFFGMLVEKGKFPQEIASKALGSSNGGMYVWPEENS